MLGKGYVMQCYVRIVSHDPPCHCDAVVEVLKCERGTRGRQLGDGILGLVFTDYGCKLRV